MRFVKDGRTIVGKDGSVFASAHGQIGEEEMMVDYDYVGFERLLPHSCDEAIIVFLALLAQADVGARIYFWPERKVFGKIFQFCPVTGFGFSRPAAHLIEVIYFIQPLENRRVLGLL